MSLSTWDQRVIDGWVGDLSKSVVKAGASIEAGLKALASAQVEAAKINKGRL